MISKEEYDVLVAIRDGEILRPREELGVSDRFVNSLYGKSYVITPKQNGEPYRITTKGNRVVEEYERNERAEQLAIKADKRGAKHLRLDYWAIIIAGISLVISIVSIVLSICK